MRSKNKENRAVSVGGWLGTILLSGIPVVNLVMWIIWAFSAKRKSRRTFSIAMIILTVIFAGLIAGAVCFHGAEILEWARKLDPELFTPKGIE